MAGEDPGVGTLSVVLDLIKQAGSTVTGTLKNLISFSLDVVKTGIFISWRRKMMNAQKGPDLTHGKQSLKELREHEQIGAEIVSVNIGDKKAMKALDAELSRLEIDYAITNDGGKDKVYTLHYKSTNELDVMLAQANALQRLYGNPEKGAPEVEQVEQIQQSNQIDNENAERINREAAERQQQEQQQTQESLQQDQNRQQQETVSASNQVQPEGTDLERGRADQRESIGADAAMRTVSQPVMAYGAAKAVPVDKLQQKLQEFRSRDKGSNSLEQSAQALQREPEGRDFVERNPNSLARSVYEHGNSSSLDELKQQAKDRARAKNLTRKARSKDINRTRSMTRARHRGLELGH